LNIFIDMSFLWTFLTFSISFWTAY
jgi:hypothetical protein